jgi:hypothetical protein
MPSPALTSDKKAFRRFNHSKNENTGKCVCAVARRLSADPALGEYIPSAPINDEARRRNGNLPGMGGVFNYVNPYAYHYAGNNPVRYVDPDGRNAYNFADEDITVLDEKTNAVIVRPGEKFEGRIDGVKLSDGTIVKVTDSDTFEIRDKEIPNPAPPVHIVITKTNGEYKVFFADLVSEGLNTAGEFIKEKDELPSGVYSPEAVEKYASYFSRWQELADVPNAYDERVKDMSILDMPLKYFHASKLNERD